MSPVRQSHGAIGTLAAALLATGIAACGDAVRLSSSRTAFGARPAVVSIAPSPTNAAREAKHPPRVLAVRPQHGAADFRLLGADNSVPDFGREAGAAQRRRAAAALTAYLRAQKAGDWTVVCKGLAQPARRPLEAIAKLSNGKLRSCAGVVAALLAGRGAKRAGTPAPNGLAAIRIDGKTAFALYYGANAGKYVMPMQDERGVWKMTQLTPLPYPLVPAVPSG